MKAAVDVLKAVGITILLIATALTIPILSILLGVGIVISIIYFLVSDHREYKSKSESKKT